MPKGPTGEKRPADVIGNAVKVMRMAAAGARGVVSGNLSTIAGARTVADEVNKLGRFDAVIHNAGIGYREGRVEVEPGVPSVFAVNVLAPYILTALMEGPNDRALLDDLGDSEGTSSRRQRRSLLATLDLRPTACQQRVWRPALWRSGPTKRQSIGPVEDLVRFEPPKPLSALKVFVASYVARQSGHRQVDVSHRGGKPGFVRIGPDGGGARCFQIPD
jgi:hypothetical protein